MLRIEAEIPRPLFRVRLKSALLKALSILLDLIIKHDFLLDINAVSIDFMLIIDFLLISVLPFKLQFSRYV